MNPPSTRAQVLALLASLVVTFAAAAIGGSATLQAATFYAQLQRPAWAPPGWLFGPVWTLLYLLMAVAAWLIWRAGQGAPDRRALVLFGLQLVANALWSWLFFAWRLGFWAFVEVLVLWALVLVTGVVFGRIRRLAALLWLPYLAWVSFAAALTWAIWRLNPALLG